MVGTVPQPYGTHSPTAYDSIISNEAAATHPPLDPEVLRAVIAAKGGFQAKPDRYVGGAYGLMLVSPMAAKAVGLGGADLKDPKTNIQAGATLLSRLVKHYGDISHALAAYEVGAAAVPDGGDIPNDPRVKYFLAAYELAYRGGPQKPPVIPVVPPKHPFVQQETQALKEKAGFLKKALEYRVRGLPWSVARYVPMVIAEAEAAKPVPADPELVMSIMFAESGGYDTEVSTKGAQGLMQLMPGTAKDLKVKLTNPLAPTEEDNRENIRGGIKHLNGLLDHFNSADRDQQYVLAVVAYNAGEKAKAIGKLRDNKFPGRQIESYVRKVFTMYNKIIGPEEKPVNYEKYLPAPEATAIHKR
jgi:soluble lytic murein transglycosylase-like protein